MKRTLLASLILAASAVYASGPAALPSHQLPFGGPIVYPQHLVAIPSSGPGNPNEHVIKKPSSGPINPNEHAKPR